MSKAKEELTMQDISIQTTKIKDLSKFIQMSLKSGVEKLLADGTVENISEWEALYEGVNTTCKALNNCADSIESIADSCMSTKGE